MVGVQQHVSMDLHTVWLIHVEFAPRMAERHLELVLGPLEEIRTSLRDAKEDAENEFTPKRRIALPGKPNIVTFANQDSALLIGLEQGVAMSFDSAALLSAGTDEVQPVNTVQLQGSPLRQILPNPGTDSALVDKVAIVGDGTAQIFNSRLEPQGGWTASDPSTNPVCGA